MINFLFALANVAHAACWTLAIRAGEIRVVDGLKHYACYGAANSVDLPCYSTAVFATDEEVARLEIKEDGVSTLLISEVRVSNSIWDDTVQNEQRPVECQPFSLVKCARRLLGAGGL